MSKNGETTDDFAAMLAAYDVKEKVKLHAGQRISGKVIHISKENVFVQLSGSQEGVLPRAEITDQSGHQAVALGDTIDAIVVSLEAGIVLSKHLSRDNSSVEMLEQARDNGIAVEGTVTGVNKGGLEVTVGNTRGFCPMGQADIGFVENPEKFIGQTLQFMVREVKERGRNVVLSRRALMEAERAEKAAALRGKLAVGQRHTGVVSRIAKFGVFVDLGGIDGLIPMGELAHGRVENAEELLRTGESVLVEIRAIEADPKRPGEQRISLSRKAALDDPWKEYESQLVAGHSLEGRVVRLEPFGAFVELFPGVQGLVHISEMSTKRVRHPSDVAKVGDTVTVRVVSTDANQRRIALSLKELRDNVASSSPAPARNAGAKVEGTVERIESYGVFVTLDNGGSALLPAAETGTPRGTDLSRAFPIGTRLALQVLSSDEKGRMRVSKTARERSDEASEVADYNRSQNKGSGFGTLGDLLSKRKR